MRSATSTLCCLLLAAVPGFASPGPRPSDITYQPRALGSHLAGGTFTVSFFSVPAGAPAGQSTFTAPIVAGAAAGSGVSTILPAGAAGPAVSLSVVGDTYQTTWEITSSVPTSILVTTIDLAGSVSVFDDGSVPSTPNSARGRKYTHVGTAPAILVDPKVGEGYATAADKSLGDLYKTHSIVFGPGAFVGVAGGRLLRYKDDTDIPDEGSGCSLGSSECEPCPGDDIYEPNDTCAASVALSTGLTTPLAVQSGNNDFYSIDVPPGERLLVHVAFSHNEGDVDAELWTQGCGSLLDTGYSETDDEFLKVSNTSGLQQTYQLRVSLYLGSCNNYDLEVDIGPDPCTSGIDDGLEENDTCASALALPLGGYAPLFVSKTDRDYYELLLPAGETLDVSCNFPHWLGDIDIFLRDACGGSVLAQGISATDNEHVQWVNTTGSLAVLQLEVQVWSGSDGDCNTYGLYLDSSATACNASNFCSSTPNSTGGAALMSSNSECHVADNDFVLQAMPVPSQPGLFFFAANQVAGGSGLPFGNGRRCVGAGSIQRLPIVFPSGGVLTYALDFTSPYGAAIVPGSTWYFQAWFRDPAGGGSFFDLSDGLSMTFE